MAEQFSSIDGLSSRRAATTFSGNAKEKLKNLARYVEINQAFKFSLAPDDVLTLVVDAAIELAGAERGLIMLKGDGEVWSLKLAAIIGGTMLSKETSPLVRAL